MMLHPTFNPPMLSTNPKKSSHKSVLDSDFSIDERDLFFALAPSHIMRNSNALLSQDLSFCRDLARTIKRARKNAIMMAPQAPLQPIESIKVLTPSIASHLLPLTVVIPAYPVAAPVAMPSEPVVQPNDFTHVVVVPDAQDSSTAAACDILPVSSSRLSSTQSPTSPAKLVTFADPVSAYLSATPSPTNPPSPHVALVPDPPHDPPKSDEIGHPQKDQLSDVRLNDLNEAARALASMYDSEPAIFQIEK